MVIRVAFWLTAILACSAGGIAIEKFFTVGSDATAPTETLEAGSDPLIPLVTRRRAVGPSAWPPPQPAARSTARLEFPSVPVGTSASQSTWTKGSAAAEEVDSGAVGRRFPISASVESDCNRRLSDKDSDAICADLYKALSEMSKEPRDSAWARSMESMLRNMVMTASETYEIRGIECRTSLCALEVSSIYGQFLYSRHISHDDALYDGLYDLGATTGYEKNASDQRITVTFLMLHRR